MDGTMYDSDFLVRPQRAMCEWSLSGPWARYCLPRKNRSVPRLSAKCRTACFDSVVNLA